jgi:hypothetical protein
MVPAVTPSRRRLWTMYKKLLVEDGMSRRDQVLARSAFHSGARGGLKVHDHMVAEGDYEALHKATQRHGRLIKRIQPRRPRPRRHWGSVVRNLRAAKCRRTQDKVHRIQEPTIAGAAQRILKKVLKVRVMAADLLAMDIAAYEAARAGLEKEHNGKWVVFHAGALVTVYADFDSAAMDAVGRFGRGPYLIRQIGAPPLVLPASAMYVPQQRADKVRL